MKQQQEYSKKVLDNELALLWVNTIGMMALAFYCVYTRFDAAFPWLTAMVGLPWAAWGVSKTGYTMKSAKQNTAGGITYETAMLAAKAEHQNPQTIAEETVTDL
ncbi:hypothetical protein [Anaerotignum sp.]